MRNPHYKALSRCGLGLAFQLAILAASIAQAQVEPAGFLGVELSDPGKVDDFALQTFSREMTAEEFLKGLRLRPDDRGALVMRVLPGMPAEAGGLAFGDLVIAANGVAITDSEKCVSVIGALKPGTDVELTVLRACREKKLVARLAARPPQFPLPFQPAPAPPAETPKPAFPPDALLTAEEVAKALAGDPGPAPAAVPDYDAAVKLYRESAVAKADGLLFAAPIAFGGDEGQVAARLGDELFKLGDRPVATPLALGVELQRRKDSGEFPLTAEVHAAGGAEDVRTIRIENARDADMLAAASFFTDEDRIRLWLSGLSSQGSAKAAGEPKPLPALTQLQPRQLLACVAAARALRLSKLAEEAASVLQASHAGSPEAAALRARDQALRSAAWMAQLRDSAAAGDIERASAAARSILAQDRQGRFGSVAREFMDRLAHAAAAPIQRGEKLLDAGDSAGARRETARVAAAIPDDERLVRLLGRCDNLDTLRAGRSVLAEGQLRRARLLAESVMGSDPDGADGRQARRLLDEIRSIAKARTDRANRLLDAGDPAAAQDELVPVLQAFPNDAAALAAWERSRKK